MNKTIRVGIAGCGNLGRGVRLALKHNPDMELAGVFSRRNPASLQEQWDVPVYSTEELPRFRDRLDVLILCGGSATDLPRQTPEYAQYFNVVDSYDTHARIPDHFAACHKAASAAGRIALLSVGWDPGIFSLQRLLGSCILPQGKNYTFWGTGVSQGHSDAIRRIEGVTDGKQYTVPVEETMDRIRRGETPSLSAREKHKRVCYVVAEPSADLAEITRQIQTMPDYFADYDTTVHFISQEELDRDHKGIPHGGTVLHSGLTGEKNQHRQLMEFSLRLDSNPEFTAGVLVCYARAAVRLNREGVSGAKTLFDIPPAYLSPKSGADLRKELL